MRACWLPLLLILCWLLVGCGGPGPIDTVRQFHIAALTGDETDLNRVQDTTGATTPASDFKLLRDLLIHLTRTYKTTEKEPATRLIDATCHFSENTDYQGAGKEILCAADLAQVFVPFLGDAARNVMGKPKATIKYAVKVEQQGGRWVVKSVTLPMDQIVKINENLKLTLEGLEKVPGT